MVGSGAGRRRGASCPGGLRGGAAVVALLLVLAGCSDGGDAAAGGGTGGGATGAASARPAGPSPSSSAARPKTSSSTDSAAAAARWRKGSPALTAALAELAEDRPDFAVAVRDNRSGAVYSYRGRTRFETASVVKVDVLAALLLQAQNQDRPLTSAERGLARRMITASDNAATSALYRKVGRSAGLRRANERLGLTHTTPASSWGLTRTTALDQARLVSELRDGRGPLSPASRTYATGLMRAVVPGQRWGVSAAARSGEKVALKNGWLPRSTEGHRWIVNSVGRVTGKEVDVSIAVLSHGHRSQASGIATVEEVAELTRTHLRW
ncbi:MAG TPA: serine hydrolase [Dermatophilaceae bacterium]|nr:serine hydrolase [Dermatophilaceae bacterium]